MRARRWHREMQKRGEVERVRFGVVRRRHRPQKVRASDNLVHRPDTELRQKLPHLLGDEKEIVHDVLWLSREPSAQLRVLRRDPNRARVEMALPHHHASFDDERSGCEAELIGAEERGDDDIPAGLELAIRLEPDATMNVF